MFEFKEVEDIICATRLSETCFLFVFFFLDTPKDMTGNQSLKIRIPDQHKGPYVVYM